jgi:hypothetical protein
MKVAVLFSKWEYDGDSIVDIFETKEKAEQEMERIDDGDRSGTFMGYHVEEMEVK